MDPDSDKKSLIFSQYQPTRAKSFKISSATANFAQYVRTVKAYALAGLPLEHIANAGEEIGDLVERAEIDASLLESSQSKAGEIAEDENKILAWQNRGEQISIINQLPSAQPVSQTEIAPLSNNLVTTQSQPQTANVLEGIAVFNQNNSQLETNPYLRAPADLKKAA